MDSMEALYLFSPHVYAAGIIFIPSKGKPGINKVKIKPLWSSQDSNLAFSNNKPHCNNGKAEKPKALSFICQRIRMPIICFLNAKQSYLLSDFTRMLIVYLAFSWKVFRDV